MTKFRVPVMLFLLLLLSLQIMPVLAQSDTAAPPAVQETQVPDLTPVFDDLAGGLRDFFTSSAVLMGVLAYLATQVLKFVFKQEQVETKTLYGGVVVVFTLLYMGANLAGYQELLGKGVQVGTVIADVLLTLLGMLTVPSVAYATGKRLDNPLLGGTQGHQMFSLGAPNTFKYLPYKVSKEALPPTAESG